MPLLHTDLQNCAAAAGPTHPSLGSTDPKRTLSSTLHQGRSSCRPSFSDRPSCRRWDRSGGCGGGRHLHFSGPPAPALTMVRITKAMQAKHFETLVSLDDSPCHRTIADMGCSRPTSRNFAVRHALPPYLSCRNISRHSRRHGHSREVTFTTGPLCSTDSMPSSRTSAGRTSWMRVPRPERLAVRSW